MALHFSYRCPCGSEFGPATDHPQSEKLCPEHQSGSGWRGVKPEYVKGMAHPEKFDEFLVEEQERRAKEGRQMPPGFEPGEGSVAPPELEALPAELEEEPAEQYDEAQDEAEDREEEDADAAATPKHKKPQPRKKK